MFQIRKCSDDECLTCLPVRLPAEVFDKIHILPAPILDTSKEYYRKFTSVYGSTPTAKDKPSIRLSLEASTEDKENKSVLVAQKVQTVVKCCICHKPRCVYSNTKLTRCMNEDISKVIENEEYACGGSLLSDDKPTERFNYRA